MVLVGAVAKFYALEQLIGYVRIARRRQEGRKPIEAGHDAVADRICRDMTGPAQNRWHAETAFHDCSLALRKRRCSTIGPGEDFGAVVGAEDDDSIVIQAEVLELLHHQADVIIELSHTG